MADSILTLEHCEAFFSEGPETRLTFKRPPVKLQLSDWSIKLLMKYLPGVVTRVALEDNNLGPRHLSNQILASLDLSKSATNCVKLEGSLYEGKTYIFLKSFFKDRNERKDAKLPPDQEGDDLLKDDLQMEFEKLVESSQQRGPSERWIPRTCPIRLTLEDVPKLRKFILDHYKQMS